jgi:hypothetical protein
VSPWPAPLLQRIDDLFEVTLAVEIANIADEAKTLFLDAGTLLDRGTTEGHASRRAEYVLLEVFQLQYMERALALCDKPRELRDRARAQDASSKVQKAAAAIRELDQEFMRNVFEPDTAAAFGSDLHVMSDYLPRMKLVVSACCLASWSPLFFARDIFAAYAGKTPNSAAVMDVALSVLKTVAIDFVAKSNPIIGPVLAIAESVRRNEERRLNTLIAGVEERDRYLTLEESIEAGRELLDAAEAYVSESLASLTERDAAFNRAVARIEKVAAFLKSQQSR